jgi:dolichol-phosphate mannosyltransferase
MLNKTDWKIAVVIPCFKVRKHILNVLSAIGTEVDIIYVVYDKCPEQTGQFVVDQCTDPRVRVLFNPDNLGVGGATIKGYEAALYDQVDIVVKIDGDEQMDPRLCQAFIQPIKEGHANYTKGNRFANTSVLYQMPKLRLFGNAGLSFLTKLSSGYWNIFDVTNGYTAIQTSVLKLLPLKKIDQRYFFESDMLFRLNLARAVVADIPMHAVYANEVSNLNIFKIILPFLLKNIRNLGKRLLYTYYLRDVSIASIQLLFGLLLSSFGALFGVVHWWQSAVAQAVTPSGTVMIAALPLLVGIQLLISFVSFDIAATPKIPLKR